MKSGTETVTCTDDKKGRKTEGVHSSRIVVTRVSPGTVVTCVFSGCRTVLSIERSNCI